MMIIYFGFIGGESSADDHKETVRLASVAALPSPQADSPSSVA